MLQRFRETLTILFIALLPLHAFLVTVGTKLLLGPGHKPLPMLALWKEGLLGVLMVVMFLEWLSVVSSEQLATSKDYRNPPATRYPLGDVIDLLIVTLVGIALLLHFAFDMPSTTGVFALGFKYDFVPLIAFLVARRVPWSEAFRRHAITALWFIGGGIALYGIISFFLPSRFFTWLGYANEFELYFHDAPLTSFQRIAGTELRRIQSTMSGPNQLGLWLLIPWSLGLVMLFSRLKTHNSRLKTLLYILVIGIALFMSFSRSAWIGGLVMLVAALRKFSTSRKAVSGERVANSKKWKDLPAATRYLLLTLPCIFFILLTLVVFLFPDVFIRLGSSRGHITRPIEAIERMIERPLGMGLGAAGPASTKSTDTCVFLRPQDDPRWARQFPRLCVYVGGNQVQPVGHSCECPFHPENWYLQIGVELGWVGLVMYVILVIIVLLRLKAVSGERVAAVSTEVDLPATRYPLVMFLTFLGISIGALLLHAWEDAAVAYTVWMLAGSILTFIPSQSDS